MIISLNVNNFVGQDNWINLQGEFNKKIQIWNDHKEYYYSYISEHLKTDSDVVILHEVPYIKEESYNYNGTKKFKRCVVFEKDIVEDNYTDIYKDILKYCSDSKYSMLTSKSDDTSFFITVAICKETAYKICDYQFEDYKRRFVVIENKTISSEIIIGVHVKDDTYWEQLINLFQLVNMKKDKTIIIIGDMNVFMPGTSQKKYFNELLSKGLFDAWIEMGNSNFDATYVKDNVRTRIDYALLSDNGYKRYNMFKDDSVRILGHSDHSAIIINKIAK